MSLKKNLYIKTEPGGKVGFGKLTEYDEDLFRRSKIAGRLSADLLFKFKRGVPPYRMYVGVTNVGCSGEKGNEGIIKLAEDRVGIPAVENGELASGVYFVYLALSKASVEFTVSSKLADIYDEKQLEEVSVHIDLPDCVRHPTYENLKFNIVDSYLYEGKAVKGANKGIVDRGYDECLTVFKVQDDKVFPLYTSVGERECFFGSDIER